MRGLFSRDTYLRRAQQLDERQATIGTQRQVRSHGVWPALGQSPKTACEGSDASRRRKGVSTRDQAFDLHTTLAPEAYHNIAGVLLPHTGD